ncbi:MAG: TolC family protein [Candidatus Omnitrophota bacterium]|jgi:outer membrane protein TolC
MLFLSKNAAKLLKLFLDQPEEAFYIQQLGRILKKKPGVFQRTLYKMEKQGILKSEYKANARFFRINKGYPVYRELKSIVSKTAGICIIFLFIGFCAASIGSCQEANDSTVTLTSLNDAINVAFKNNKNIQIQEKQVDISRADILGARSNFLPSADFNASYTHRGAVLNSPMTSKKDTGVFSGYKNDNNVGVSIDQTIYSGGANTANLREKQLTMTEQEETLRAARLNVELETKRLYYGLLLAYETKQIAEDLVAQAQAHYEYVKHKYEQGTASKFDVLQSKVQVSLLMPELINAINSIDLIMAELNQVLGLKILDTIKVEDKLEYSPIKITERDFLKEAYLNKPEMIIQSIGIDINKWAIKFAKAGWLPQVSAGADYSYRSNNLGNMFNNRHNNWNVGVALNFSIFDGFATKAKVDAAKARYAQSLISKENVADQIAVSVRNDCVDLRNASAIIISQRDNLEDAKEALMIAEVRYDNGIGINLDVLDAQASLAQVRQNLASGIYDYIVAKADLDRNMGVEYLKDNSQATQKQAVKK